MLRSNTHQYPNIPKYSQLLWVLVILLLENNTLRGQVNNYELLNHLNKAVGTENKRIGAEKTLTKRYTKFRAFTQNNFTYYNFFFNATDQFSELIKEAQERVYNKNLKEFELSFGNEDLAYLKKKEKVLDTIIAKCNAGILVHDLRNKWADDLLLLMGKCYYYKQYYDTAFSFFQYINNAYKLEGGYDNTTIYLDKNDHYSIASKEKERKQRFPPARNEALLWIARTLVAKGDVENAAGIITLLLEDDYFPSRLEKQLLHALAFLRYKEKRWGDVAKILEQIAAMEPKRKRKSPYITNQFLLSASLYEKGYLYHDAYRMYKKTARTTKDRYKKMYAEIQALGLDYRHLALQQIQKIASNKKYRKYKPYLYYEIAKKMYNLKMKQAFEPTALKAFQYKEEIGNDKHRHLLLMLTQHLIETHQYQKAGKYLYQIKPAPSEEEIEKYNILQAKDIHDLYIIQRKIDFYDSLIAMSRLSSREINHLANKLKRQTISGASPQKSKSEKQSNWYFDNNYLLINGKQQFIEQYGSIVNADMWRVEGINESVEAIQHTLLDEKNDDIKNLEDFMSKIPTTAKAKQAYRDSLFFALADIVQLSLNSFTNHKAAIPALERALQMKDISANVIKSKKRNNLQIIQSLLSNKEQFPRKSAERVKKYYQKILDGYINKQYRQLLNNHHAIDSLSTEQRQKYALMQASSYAKIGMEEEAEKKLRELVTKKNTYQTLKEKAQEMLTYLLRKDPE